MKKSKNLTSKKEVRFFICPECALFESDRSYGGHKDAHSTALRAILSEPLGSASPCSGRVLSLSKYEQRESKDA